MLFMSLSLGLNINNKHKLQCSKSGSSRETLLGSKRRGGGEGRGGGREERKEGGGELLIKGSSLSLSQLVAVGIIHN